MGTKSIFLERGKTMAEKTKCNVCGGDTFSKVPFEGHPDPRLVKAARKLYKEERPIQCEHCGRIGSMKRGYSGIGGNYYDKDGNRIHWSSKG
ncbi:uncharacterized protein METZ01_LOCUS91098 [marine metagenome]|uniref:Uncharacterized protein n=1 Tax=marine metagenome TaxID=408172 RepID=A0A381VDK6_9ZZZZ